MRFGGDGYNTKDRDSDVIGVNGDNNPENLRKPDLGWQVQLIEEEFPRRIFAAEQAQESALCERQAFISGRAPSILMADIHTGERTVHVNGRD